MAFIPAVLPSGLFSGIPWLVTPGVLLLSSIILGLWDQPHGVPAAGEGHGAQKAEKHHLQWSDLLSSGLSLWFNHYPVLIAQPCPPGGHEWHRAEVQGAGTAQELSSRRRLEK